VEVGGVGCEEVGRGGGGGSGGKIRKKMVLMRVDWVVNGESHKMYICIRS